MKRLFRVFRKKSKPDCPKPEEPKLDLDLFKKIFGFLPDETGKEQGQKIVCMILEGLARALYVSFEVESATLWKPRHSLYIDDIPEDVARATKAVLEVGRAKSAFWQARYIVLKAGYWLRPYAQEETFRAYLTGGIAEMNALNAVVKGRLA